MTEVAADIWIVTETPAQFPLTGFATADSAPMLTARPAAFTIIAAPELTQLPVPELPTGTAALIENRDGKWLVVGVCMPWRAGSPTLPPQAAPGASTGPAQWHHVLSALDAAINRLRTVAPDAELLVHPECGCASQCMAFGNERTHILSTEGMINFAKASPKNRFLVATETGIIHRLNKEAPTKRFEAVSEKAICKYMKMITLEKLRDSLRDWKHIVTVEPEIAERARGAIERMVAIS
jgi:hypothetical protein